MLPVSRKAAKKKGANSHVYEKFDNLWSSIRVIRISSSEYRFVPNFQTKQLPVLINTLGHHFIYFFQMGMMIQQLQVFVNSGSVVA